MFSVVSPLQKGPPWEISNITKRLLFSPDRSHTMLDSPIIQYSKSRTCFLSNTGFFRNGLSASPSGLFLTSPCSCRTLTRCTRSGLSQPSHLPRLKPPEPDEGAVLWSPRLQALLHLPLSLPRCLVSPAYCGLASSTAEAAETVSDRNAPYPLTSRRELLFGHRVYTHVHHPTTSRSTTLPDHGVVGLKSPLLGLPSGPPYPRQII